MKPLKKLSIRSKITLVILGVASTGLLLFSLIILLYTAYTTITGKIADYKTDAAILAKTVTAAVAFDDAKAASDILSALSARPDITGAVIYDRYFTVLAGYTRDPAATVGASERRRSALPDKIELPAVTDLAPVLIRHVRFDQLAVFAPIVLDTETIGVIEFRIDLSGLVASIQQYVLVSVGILLLCLLAASGLSEKLQLVVLRPIQILTEGIRLIARDKDYSARVIKTSHDELGTLIDHFNAMLAEIERRDAALARHRDELEREVAVRTAELRGMVQDLARARDTAEDASRAKSQFLANMSHEIRTPMNGVLGMAELLASTSLTERQRRFTQTIRSSAEALLAIINDILDFSKIEAGRMELSAAAFDLRDLAEDVSEFCAEGAHRKGLEIACSLPPDLPRSFMGDAGRLRQVLVNLIGNAIKFTTAGEVSLRVDVVEEMSEEAVIAFAVKDTGIGIKPEQLPRIFESFRQADGSTTRRFGGTGLGLTISKQLVELMGGQIQVESTVGQGSTFRFTVRLHKVAEPRPVATPPSIAGARILIVDDNATNREILEHQLSGWRVDHESAADGPQALTRLADATRRGRPFEMVMLDHHMPGMDGIEVARRIRHDQNHGCMQLMMLSSVSDQIDPDELARVGVAACLNKPVRQSALYNALAAAFCHQRPGVGSGRAESHTAGAPVHEVAFLGRVLLAEDNVVNQEVAVNMLEGLNCQVAVAGNGLEALAALERESFDLVLMDCQMPELDGFATTAEIRRREAAAGRSPRPILALTANAMEGDRERCIEAGMDDYLSKPFTCEALAAMLGRYLQRAPTSASPASASPAVPLAASAAGGGAGEPLVIDTQSLKPIIALARPGRPSPLVKVISLYLDAWPEQNEKLRLAVATADADAMWKLAHALKSSSAIVGALGLSSIFKHLEALGRSGTTAGANEAFAEIEHLFPAVRQALLAICKEQAA
jgi:signal transduction histidine kinase/DNA-binding response OmpR family regulator/HPt (histidine-containing phosphotransfer) domain-containing protein